MKVVKARSAGLSPDRNDNTENLLTFLDSLRGTAGPVTIRFEPGTYRFGPEKGRKREIAISNHTSRTRNIIFDLSGFCGLTLEGEGTALLFSGDCLPFALEDSREITIRGFSVDYTDPTCLQGIVTRRGFFSHTLKISEEHRCLPGLTGLRMDSGGSGNRITEAIEWDPVEKRRVYRARPASALIGPARQTGPRTWRIRSRYTPRIGSAVVMRAGERTQPGVLISRSAGILLEDVTLRHCKAIGVLGQMSENITLKGVSLAPDENSGRCFSGHDDAYHFSNCRVRILLEGCTAQGQMDDGLNVHGTYTQLGRRITGRHLVLVHQHRQSRGFNLYRPGDTVAFLDRRSLTEGFRGEILQARVLPDGNVDVLLDRNLPAGIRKKAVVENLSAAVDLTVRGCTFKNNRARGVLVTAGGKVLIENNYFSPTGAGVLIAGDACSWYESGGVRDVTIRGNEFENCNTELFQYCRGVISILPELRSPRRNRRFHRNITITGNRIRTFDAPVLYARCAGNLTFEGNFIERTRDYRPWHPDRNRYRFDYCDGVTLRNNSQTGEPVSRKIRQKHSAHVTVKSVLEVGQV